MNEQLDELLGAGDGMERLLRVIVGLASDLDFDATLHRIVTAAMELTGARYGALGVRGTDGTLVSCCIPKSAVYQPDSARIWGRVRTSARYSQPWWARPSRPLLCG